MLMDRLYYILFLSVTTYSIKSFQIFTTPLKHDSNKDCSFFLIINFRITNYQIYVVFDKFNEIGLLLPNYLKVS